jgi:aconitate hydratase 2/2-methylisocitrate dehydratase
MAAAACVQQIELQLGHAPGHQRRKGFPPGFAMLEEPILCCPNDPDDAKFLSELAVTQIDEAFTCSSLTIIGHFRAAAKPLGGSRDIPVKLWVAPPTKMDESELIKEGHCANFGAAGARTEMPGCTLCMGNQAQVS